MVNNESGKYKIFFCVNGKKYMGVWAVEEENFQYKENMEKILWHSCREAACCHYRN